MFRIIIFYLLFPLTGVAFSLYNTVLSNELVLDEVCGMAQRSSWTQILMFAIQGSGSYHFDYFARTTQVLFSISTAITVILYFLIYRKVTRHLSHSKSISGNGNLVCV